MTPLRMLSGHWALKDILNYYFFYRLFSPPLNLPTFTSLLTLNLADHFFNESPDISVIEWCILVCKCQWVLWRANNFFNVLKSYFGPKFLLPAPNPGSGLMHTSRPLCLCRVLLGLVLHLVTEQSLPPSSMVPLQGLCKNTCFCGRCHQWGLSYAVSWILFMYMQAKV